MVAGIPFVRLEGAVQASAEPKPLPAAPGAAAESQSVASVLAGVINVRTYGAKGDGSTNDQPMIQAAIDAARPGSTIYFPVGTYRLDAPVRVKTSPLILNGDGPGSVIQHGGNDGLILEGDRTSQGLAVTRLKFRGIPGKYGGDGNRGKAITINGPQGSIIQQCDFEGPGTAVFNSSDPTYGTQILDCRVRGWGEIGIFCNSGEQVLRCTLVQDDPNITGQRSAYGIFLHSGARGTVISDCLIENARDSAFQLTGQDAGATLQGIQILKNTVRGCQTGILVSGSAEGPVFQNLAIEDNQFEGIRSAAVRIRKGTGITVLRNTISGSSAAIVLADWEAGLKGYVLQYVQVSQNKISQCDGAIFVVVNNGGQLNGINFRDNTITNCPSSIVTIGISGAEFTTPP